MSYRIPRENGYDLYFESYDEAVSATSLMGISTASIVEYVGSISGSIPILRALSSEESLTTYAKNNFGTLVSVGDVVTLNAESDGRMIISNLTDLSDINTSNVVIGISTNVIPSGRYGYVSLYGIVSNINTTDLVSGSAFYLSDISPGNFTSTPTSIQLGTVIDSHPSRGIVFVNPKNVDRLVETCSFSLTSSYVDYSNVKNITSASTFLGTSSYSQNSFSSSYSVTSSWAANSSSSLQSNTSQTSITSSYSLTSSFSQFSGTASYVLNQGTVDGIWSAIGTGTKSVLVANTWTSTTQSIILSTSSYFSHPTSGGEYTCLVSDYYQIVIWAYMQKAGGTSQIGGVRLTLDGAPVSSSLSSYSFGSNNIGITLTSTTAIHIDSGSIIRFDFGGTGTSIQYTDQSTFGGQPTFSTKVLISKI